MLGFIPSFLVAYFFSVFCFSQNFVTLIQTDRWNDPLLSVSINAEVIDRGQIENSGATNLKEILQSKSGLYILESGPGGPSSLFLRGSNSNQVLVLFDGIVLNDHTDPSGRFDFSNFSIIGIERIEIYKGNMSALYGSGAIGGVISIISQTKADTKLKFGMGSNQERKVQMQGNIVSTRNQNVNLSIANRLMEGPSAKGGRSSNIELDSSDTKDLFSSYIYKQEGREIRAFVKVQNKFSQFDQDSPNDDISDGKSLLKLYSVQLKASKNINLNWSKKSSDRRYLYSPSSKYTYKGVEDTLSLYYFSDTDNRKFRYALSAQKTLRSTQIDSSDKIRGEYNAIATQLSVNPHRSWDWTLGFRVDQPNSETGFPSLRSSIVRHFEASDIEISLANAFSFPSAYQLYDPVYGNEDLKEEKSRSLEFLWRKYLEQADISLSIYKIISKDLIDFSVDHYQNINEAELSGLELTYKRKADLLNYQLVINLQEAKDRKTGDYLLNRPQEKLGLHLEKSFETNLFLSMSFDYVGRRQVYGGDWLDAYTLTNAYVKKKLKNNFSSNLKVSNLFNTQYEEQKGYTTIGRSLFVEIEKQF